MDHFTYRDGHLACEDVDLGELAKRVGTPTYVYSSATLRHHLDRVAEAFAYTPPGGVYTGDWARERGERAQFGGVAGGAAGAGGDALADGAAAGGTGPLICFSVKSCSNLSILRLLAERGAGMDVVSGGELHRARLAGVPASRIVYAGVGKTEEEIVDALGGGAGGGGRDGGAHAPIGMFNIESEQEFQVVASLAASMKVRCRAALRVNPDVDPHTHKYTTTGTAETKFGVDLARARQFFKHFGGHPSLRLTGLHLHLGSPVPTVEPYIEAVSKTLRLIAELESDGHAIDTLDLGGGFGADYRTGQSLAPADYAAGVMPLLRPWLEAAGDRAGKRPLRLVLEPGRLIAANAGVLLTRVQYVKTSGPKKFVIADAGMHTLIRPSLYEAFHFIWPVSVAPQHEPSARQERPEMPGLEPCDVVGPICETGDFLALDRPLPPVARGDLLAVFGAGAYGMSMASRYNSHALPAEVLVDGGRAMLARRRETYADLTEHEGEGTALSV